MDGQGNNIWIYFLFGGALLVIIGLGVVLRLLSRKGKKRYYKPAILLSSDREYAEITDQFGTTHRGIVKMSLTFGFKNGEKKTFEIDKNFRGHCKENEWGNLMYEDDKLLKFECKSGTIGTKLYVQKNNSVFNKFRNK